MKPSVFLAHEFAKEVIAHRVHNGLSQRQLAVVIDESLEAVMSLEGIKALNRPSAVAILKVCYLFGLDHAQFLDVEWKNKLARKMEIWTKTS